MPLPKLYLVLLALTVLEACSKKKSANKSVISQVSALTEASEETRLSRSVETEALNIPAIDVLGLTGTSASSLRVTATDYDKDLSRISMRDESLAALSQAQNLLCLLQQASITTMVGKGPYLAQADRETCFPSDGDRSELGHAAGRAKKVTTLAVDSVRGSNFHPFVVKAWFTIKEDGSEQSVDMQVKLVVVEGQSVENPLGIFTLTWQGMADESLVDKGMVQTKRSGSDGAISLAVAAESGQGEELTEARAAVSLTYDATLKAITGGVLHALGPSAADKQVNEEFAAVFNSTHFLRRSLSANLDTCLARDKVDSKVYRYGLYQASTGQRVARNTGFPLVYSDSEGELQHGWAGHWGVWLENGTEINDGMSVQSIDFTTEVATDYTVKKAAGKLVKRTKKTLTLEQLAGIDLETFDSQGVVIVHYDATLGSFAIRQRRDRDGKLSSAAGGYALRQAWQAGESAANEFWAESLGGLLVVFSDSSGQATGDGLYFTEENVTASAGALSLSCYQNCLQTQITQTQADTDPWDSGGDSAFFVFDPSDPAAAGNQHVYTYSSATMLLKLDILPVTLASDVTSLRGYNSWGLRAGPLLTSPASQAYEAYQSDVHYEWQIGPNAWNETYTLRDTERSAVSFEAPLALTYTHSLANDRDGTADSEYYGQAFLLHYSSFGQLQGFPRVLDASARYGDAIVLKDGTTLGEGLSYKVKALDVELSLPVQVGACAALSIGSLPDLPSTATWKAPALGDKPSVSKAPAVIDGIVQ